MFSSPASISSSSGVAPPSSEPPGDPPEGVWGDFDDSGGGVAPSSVFGFNAFRAPVVFNIWKRFAKPDDWPEPSDENWNLKIEFYEILEENIC